MRVLSLFDYTGLMVEPWQGHQVWMMDKQHPCDDLKRLNWNADEIGSDALITIFEHEPPDIVFSFPPCDDLAVSGARHFETKRAKNPDFQEIAVKRARIAAEVADWFEVPYFIENPVSVLATMWRAPDFYFHPYEYGGYLPEDDIHPLYPDYIPPRDAYPKKTGAWIGNGFVIPEKKPVPVKPGYSDAYKKLGGRSLRTKNIRSATPRGWAIAVKQANEG